MHPHQRQTRREFLARTALGAAALTVAGRGSARGAKAPRQRPNILWLTSEDNSPYLGCYGDELARTPALDGLAGQGVRFDNAFSNAAVCAPARQTIISGMYATSIGGQHMRSKVAYPPDVPFFPTYLRQAGYYTTNNSKTDYNGGPTGGGGNPMAAAWDASSSKAHWRNRPAGKPFFAVFNFTETHESRLSASKRGAAGKTDPAKVRLPAYLPDLPAIRRDLARHYDCHAAMDARVATALKELKAAGLLDETIIFYYGDHGGSMPRGKSFPYDSGTRVPMLVRVPDKWKHLAPAGPGEATDELVSFVDLAPTVLSLAGLTAPKYMQGQAFLGPHKARQPRKVVHLFRGRRGERYDIVRGVRDKRFLYLRNYTPHLPVMQHNGYAWKIASYGAWQEAVEAGTCTEAQAQWFKPKPGEQLYDVRSDPDNVRDIARNPARAEDLRRLRAENERHMLAVRDSALYPEGMTGRTHAAYQDDRTYPLADLLRLAASASDRDAAALPVFRAAMTHANPCMRYWGAMACVILGKKAAPARAELERLLEDPQTVTQICAARALIPLGHREQALPPLKGYAANPSKIIRLRAFLALDECNIWDEDIRRLAAEAIQRRTEYVERVAQHMTDRLGRRSGESREKG